MTRCFTMEYAIWFRVLLFGVRRLGIPLPLGGTSVFFHTHVLKEIGAWDAHNVTEDADLGMRLARLGYRCDLVRSVTFEEANPQLGNWLRQRSRWLKGYAVTWVNHMRTPLRLWRDLGTGPFLGFQLLLLGSVTAYLAMPLFWVLLFAEVTGIKPQWLGAVDRTVWSLFFISLPLGNLTMICAAILALYRRRLLGLLPWAFTLPAYWSLGSIASYRAIFELFTMPFHWQKTQHGLARKSVSRTETD
ncbi:cellulose synthase/poly-beta-1,6-N-acetylglucosamine synthase-like glycosyltransferase [Rubricella aquisinus]|uniref:Cellulose synthase/poly-beta-1,6-N-acetylglucosamine synthase-like glycosyltransferase n=1 Tax=Rubricella aquisinus TaxID=2028108 RepID=A0A840WMG2_9RHOB|nr:glycosyltransferase [Rubricella aquisinus]MBB5516268.1 cellulose synthase/poly-beta-1,6-N-acetylglucosamine synthase-like glycosyltransferase [Rubricella aquisinus]